jgi:hypothetical protein
VTALERDQIAAVQEAIDAAELASYMNVRGYRNLLVSMERPAPIRIYVGHPH